MYNKKIVDHSIQDIKGVDFESSEALVLVTANSAYCFGGSLALQCHYGENILSEIR